MDIQLKQKPWYIKYYRYLLAVGLFLALCGYVLSLSMGPRRLQVKKESIIIACVEDDKFMEYVDVEGVVQPIMTLQINTDEAGSVDRLVAEQGMMLQEGDTILLLQNPELQRQIYDQQMDWERQRMQYREREIEMEQKSRLLKQQVLEAEYELNRLRKSYALDKEEFKAGLKSKAQMEVSMDEFNFKTQNIRLKMEGLRQDSVLTHIRKEMLRNDMEREQLKISRLRERVNGLVIRAPIDGQLSEIKTAPGRRVSSGADIAEIRVLEPYKLQVNINEYYVDRITTGLPAALVYQNKHYPLKVSKVTPEVRDRAFSIDLAFVNELPDNIRLGKNYRLQIELEQPEQAIVMDRGNFYSSTGGQWLYKLSADGTKATKVPISIGRQNPRQYEVTSGLHAGDLVIVSGYDTFGEADELIIN
ncbi:MAG: efflux RND transporter periplasmic adaptor subunit [Marinifilaceae bacterium]